MLAGECGIGAGRRCSTPRATAAASPAEVAMADIDARAHAARAAPLVARRSDRRRRRAARRSPTPGCSTARRSHAGRRVARRRHRDLLRNEDYYRTAIDARHRRARGRRRCGITFSSTPVDVIAARFGFEGPRACVVAACSSSTIAIGQAADAIRSGRARRGAGRRHRRAGAADVQRLQRAAADGSASRAGRSIAAAPA